ncbi:MAG: hydroxyacylglutathione hydrolase [Betaproteobacteria bacterium]|nr:hydroxyacylglutathione hydrolase [Betaproteobacteria bacterium]MDE2131650.1 hydroxyacylglutathione hydrolase [Betaproteobacteria bacterium]MDE2211163.1 hydroxyacylglutathione hydrolase [Betaproteobacteria bacterium]
MSSRYEVSGVPAFNDNYIWVLHDNRHAVVVDPGEGFPVIRFLQERGLALAAILITHHHGDHVGGIEELLETHSGPVPVYGPRHETIDGITRLVGEPDTVSVPELEASFRVLDIPGHTAGHIAYWDGNRLFCGDTLFACGCGRVFEGTPDQMAASLDKLAALPENTEVYCAHEYTLSNIAFAQAVEPDNAALQQRAVEAAETRRRGLPTVPSTIGLELRTNPFLRCHEPAVIQTVLSHTGAQPADNVAVFAALRQWKNTF